MKIDPNKGLKKAGSTIKQLAKKFDDSEKDRIISEVRRIAYAERTVDTKFLVKTSDKLQALELLWRLRGFDG